MNLADNLERTARARGRSAALVVGDRVTSFAELERDSRGVAGLLAARGVRPGDRVAVSVPEPAEFAALYYGILRHGAIAVPLAPLLTERQATHLLRDADVRLLLAWAATGRAAAAAARAVGAETVLLEAGALPGLVAAAPAYERPEPRASGDTAVIAYTAGTGGPPRGAELTHGNLLRNCEVVVNDVLQLTSEDVVLGGLPLFHPFGQTVGLNAAIRAGACLALLGPFDAEEALRTLQGWGVTVMQALPAMYAALLAHPQRHDHDLSRLRVCVSAGAPLPVGVLLGFEEAFDCLVLEGYGLAEASPVTTFNRRDRRRVGSIGLPVPGVDLRVVDDEGRDLEDGAPGELLVRGHNVMKGYWRRPQETAAAVVGGWLRTGDAGTRDEDGFFYLADRRDDLIHRGDHHVPPREVEEVLQEHPDVLEAAVLGLPHPTLGEEVVAVVTLRPRTATTGDELRDFVKARVAAWKCPRTVDVVDMIPKTATGKILKREIRLETRA